MVTKRLTFSCWLVYHLRLATPVRDPGWEQEVSHHYLTRIRNIAWMSLCTRDVSAWYADPWHRDAGCLCAGWMGGPGLSRHMRWETQGAKELRVLAGRKLCLRTWGKVLQPKGWRSRESCCFLGICTMLGKQQPCLPFIR